MPAEMTHAGRRSSILSQRHIFERDYRHDDHRYQTVTRKKDEKPQRHNSQSEHRQHDAILRESRSDDPDERGCEQNRDAIKLRNNQDSSIAPITAKKRRAEARSTLIAGGAKTDAVVKATAPSSDATNGASRNNQTSIVVPTSGTSRARFRRGQPRRARAAAACATAAPSASRCGRRSRRPERAIDAGRKVTR